jgi:hypothetical protein
MPSRGACIVPPPWIGWEGKFPNLLLRGTMSEIRDYRSASCVATCFVFEFLLAAILETMIATLGR